MRCSTAADEGGADKAYDVEEFVHDLRERRVTPHIAISGAVTKTGKTHKIAIDKRTTRHPGYEISGRIRTRVEEVFGWTKEQAGYRRVKVRDRRKTEAVFTPDRVRGRLFATAAYNLIRIPKLLAE